MGSRLAARLIARGHSVAGLVRPGAENRLPAGCAPVRGNALDHTTFAPQLSGFHTYVQLVGVAHPSPTKAKEFEAIDRVSCEQSLLAVKDHPVQHFIYVSVAHPAPMMKAYIAVRTYCEEQIRSAGLNATILRPWYVLGPGHYWPYLLVPGYWVARQIPSMREGAIRLELVTLEQMLTALVSAVETPVTGIREMNVPDIKNTNLT